MRVGGISNDGMNAALLGKKENTLRAFWLQLYVNGLIAKGERYRNMPREWFRLPEGEELSDPICCAMGVMLYNFCFDMHEFDEAEQTINYMPVSLFPAPSRRCRRLMRETRRFG